MTTYTGTYKGFVCYSHRYGTYAVRDGVDVGKPNGGPRYAYLEVEDDDAIEARIDDFLEYEGMDDADLMEQAAAERQWGRPGLASAELSKRSGRAAA